MAPVIPKWKMSEEDIKLNYITPALEKEWKGFITMETSITDGQVDIRGNMVYRKPAKKADYVLYLNDNKPIAIVEAKDNNHLASYGMQQAKTYAQMLDVPFAYSSNGDEFYEYDFLTGQNRRIDMDNFPGPDELKSRFLSQGNGGKSVSQKEQDIIEQPYYSGQGVFEPRYYQRNAINRTVEAIARGQNRILLVMATGTGKTYTAFQIVYRLLKSGMKKKVLYLADRNNLVDQTITGDFKPLEKTIHKVNYAKDNKTTITSHEVYFALYQQLIGENDEAHYADLFRPDFFDLIIVDECHRGSAKADSNWRRILEYFSNATQIGMTATPKETKYASNIDYFGEPVFTYSLKQGIEDGFLAPFKVINVKTNIGEGWRPKKYQRDAYGVELEDRIYTNSDFDYNIIIEDRIKEVAGEITEYLKSTDRMSKTIVFCANEDHAERMRLELAKQNADMCKINPDYVVRITGSDEYGKGKLKYFTSVTAQFPVIATTSKLLSTGTDCKMVKLIVLDEMIGSMTEFKQIIGRGTRLRYNEGKTNFVIMDFRNVTRLFADPDWDGPIIIDEGFGKGTKHPKTGMGPIAPPQPPKPKPVVNVEGCDVEIIGKEVKVYASDGKLLRTENIIDYTKSNILGNYATLDQFINRWDKEEKKQVIVDSFEEYGIDLEKLKEEQNMGDVDDFDFICHVAYDQKPLTRRERANNVKKRDFLNKYKGVAREVIEALLDKYMNSGIKEIEKTEVLRLDPFTKYGKPSKIAQLFGGKDGYVNAVKELEEEIYRIG